MWTSGNLEEVIPSLLELRVKPWVHNPFLVDMNGIDDSDLAKDDLIDVRTKEMLRHEFYSKELEEFCCSLKHSYPHLSKQAMRALIPCVTTYLCESGFSALVNTLHATRHLSGAVRASRCAPRAT